MFASITHYNSMFGNGYTQYEYEYGTGLQLRMIEKVLKDLINERTLCRLQGKPFKKQIILGKTLIVRVFE